MASKKSIIAKSIIERWRFGTVLEYQGSDPRFAGARVSYITTRRLWGESRLIAMAMTQGPSWDIGKVMDCGIRGDWHRAS